MAEDFFESAATATIMVSFSECEEAFISSSLTLEMSSTNQCLVKGFRPGRPAWISVWGMNRLSWTCRTSWVILSPDPQHPRHREKKAKGGKYIKEPPETDFQDFPLTSNLRAMIIAGLTSDNMFIDDALYEADVMAETFLCSAVRTLGSLEMTTVKYDIMFWGNHCQTCGQLGRY